MAKVDLTVLKRLVSELESILATTEGIKTDVNSDKVEFIVEMSKATGICSGIVSESILLMGDIQHLVQGPNAPNLGKSDFLDKILGGLKGSGNAN